MSKEKISITGINIDKIKDAMGNFDLNAQKNVNTNQDRKGEVLTQDARRSGNGNVKISLVNKDSFSITKNLQDSSPAVKKEEIEEKNSVKSETISENKPSEMTEIEKITRSYQSQSRVHFDLNVPKEVTKKAVQTENKNTEDKNEKYIKDKKIVNRTYENKEKESKNSVATTVKDKNEKRIAKYGKKALISEDLVDINEEREILSQLHSEDDNEERSFEDDEFIISEHQLEKDEEKFFGKSLSFTEEANVYKPTVYRRSNRIKKYDTVVRSVVIDSDMSVRDLGTLISEKTSEILKYLKKEGIQADIDSVLDADTAEIIAFSMGHKVQRVHKVTKYQEILNEYENISPNKERAPIVAVMGHVDHGKTTLLDVIRKANVAGGEKGGITQHIGAYTVEHNKKYITFLDTPGHAAFNEIRKTGAKVTDIAILLVAADDGIQNQTIEAINAIKETETEMIVVINKIDKPDANATKIKQALLQHNVMLEEFGGSIPVVEVSAKNNVNIDKLLETITLHTEVMELKSDTKARAIGNVIESKFIKSVGLGITIIVQHGVVKKGDILFSDDQFCKVKYIVNDQGKRVDEIEAGFCGEVFGFDTNLQSGSLVIQAKSEKEAREVVEEFKNNKVVDDKIARNLDFFADEKNIKKITMVLKADTYGSLQALTKMITDIKHEALEIKIISSGLGMVTESDVNSAKASGAFVVAFNTAIDARARALAKTEKIEILLDSIIYKLIDSVADVISGQFDMIKEEVFIGKARVKQVFETTGGVVAGCVIEDGKAIRGCLAKVKRRFEEYEIQSGVKSIRRFKDEVKEITSGYECGIQIVDAFKFEVDDVVEFYEEILKKQKLEI